MENQIFIDKVCKFITKGNREIIGSLKAYNKEGNFYLTDCVEVFDKRSEHFATNELFENNNDHKFYYETENCQYQHINNCVFPLEEIGDIYMLKDEIYNKYKLMLDNFYKEENERKLKEEEAKKEEENKIINNNNENNTNEDNKAENENIDDLLKTIQKEDKKKKKKKKKKK